MTIPASVIKKLDACEALFSSPHKGEAAAARLAHARLTEKYGKPAPKRPLHSVPRAKSAQYSADFKLRAAVKARQRREAHEIRYALYAAGIACVWGPDYGRPAGWLVQGSGSTPVSDALLISIFRARGTCAAQYGAPYEFES